MIMRTLGGAEGAMHNPMLATVREEAALRNKKLKDLLQLARKQYGASDPRYLAMKAKLMQQEAEMVVVNDPFL